VDQRLELAGEAFGFCQRVENALTVPHIVPVWRKDRIVVEDDDLFAVHIRLCQHRCQPGELLVTQRTVPGLGISGAGLLQCREPLFRQSRARVIDGGGEDADIAAIEENQTILADDQIVVTTLQPDAPGDGGQMLRRDGIVVVAEQEIGRMTRFFVEGQDIVEILETAIDDVAERDDKIELFAIENLDRLGHPVKALAEIAVQRRVRIEIGILGIGDDAEAEERCLIGHERLVTAAW
jgi:hypothetical protein